MINKCKENSINLMSQNQKSLKGVLNNHKKKAKNRRNLKIKHNNTINNIMKSTKKNTMKKSIIRIPLPLINHLWKNRKLLMFR